MPRLLKDIVEVAPRYARAISLERDARSEAALQGYVLTTTARALLSRFGTAFVDQRRHRAWTLTGPYGSGKSAFLLFLAGVLGPAGSATGRLARKLLKEQDPQLINELSSCGAISREGFCPVLVSGSPGSIIEAILKATCRDVRPLYNVGRPSAAYKEIEQLSRRRAGEVSPRRLVNALSELTESLRDAGKARGLLLVIDELGKFLEHAALGRGTTDLFVLQELAEATAKSKEPTTLLVTVLHQAFDQYAAALRPRDRDEWDKIQGRFEDFAFQESPDQILQLIARALSHTDTAEARALREEATKDADSAYELGLAPAGVAKSDFIRIIERCAPLHPLVVLCLARLCRKFGQNHRSLFAFLTSREPHGFGTFLDREFNVASPPSYRLAELYDYVAESFGSALSVGDGAARWAEVQASLDRASALPVAEIRIVKTVGILSAVGAHGNLKPSASILEFAEPQPRSRVKRALDALLRESIVVERRHSGTVALWEGSDIDVDERMREAARRVQPTGNLAQRANEQWRPRPFVAKRHSYRTGTLRYFDTVFADLSSLTSILNDRREADAVLVYGLAADTLQRDELMALARSSAVRDRLDVVVAVPDDSTSLADAIRQLELLRWVQAHTPELQSDAVARREVRSRITEAESRIAREAKRLFAPDEGRGSATRWFHHGIERPIRSGRDLAEFLSTVCDSIYPNTPTLRNELINRRALSSAAAAARRNLIDAMIRRPGQERLGFEGTPPEVSIYASVLASTGIHRRRDGEWSFGAPTANAQLLAAWREIETFFDDCEVERRPVVQLFETLERPPYGVRAGVLPVLFCAALLAHDTEVALYEDGAFVPELTIDAFERVLRAADKFSVRRYRVEGVRREVFRRLAHLFGSTADPHDNLVSVVRPLYRFFGKLPPYSHRTNSVSAVAVAVRDALTSAKEPDRLLFDALPRACGSEPFAPGTANSEALREFIETLQRALLELQRAYDDLLADLRRMILRAFGGSQEDSPQHLRVRAAALAPHCVEGRLKAFVQQLQSADLSESASIEAVAAVLAGKPPKTWNDVDRARYEVALAEVARAFRHLEALVFEEIRRADVTGEAIQVFRIGVTDRHAHDFESVVAVTAKDENRLAETVIGLRSALDVGGISAEPHLALAALAMLCRDYLAEIDQQRPAPQRHDDTTVNHGK